MLIRLNIFISFIIAELEKNIFYKTININIIFTEMFIALKFFIKIRRFLKPIKN